MEAKLIKVENTFYLKQGGTILGTSSYPNLSASIGYSLSLENCQAIERGYDLDELAMEVCDCEANECDIRDEFKKGFQKALEILGDKKFSKEDLRKAFVLGVNSKTESNSREKAIQSIQQTEWDVEVEMDGPLVYPANLPKEGEERPDYKPKLDERGRLTLKRK